MFFKIFILFIETISGLLNDVDRLERSDLYRYQKHEDDDQENSNKKEEQDQNELRQRILERKANTVYIEKTEKAVEKLKDDIQSRSNE